MVVVRLPFSLMTTLKGMNAIAIKTKMLMKLSGIIAFDVMKLPMMDQPKY
jgi:hypothetical protein